MWARGRAPACMKGGGPSGREGRAGMMRRRQDGGRQPAGTRCHDGGRRPGRSRKIEEGAAGWNGEATSRELTAKMQKNSSQFIFNF